MTDLGPEERDLAGRFESVSAPAGVAGYGERTPRDFRGERWQTRPLAAVLVVALLAAGAGTYLGTRGSGTGGGAAGGGALPAARTGAVMAYDASLQKVVMFGGQGKSGPLSDTWAWDGGGWTQLHPADSPPAMSISAMGWDPQSKELVLVGVPMQTPVCHGGAGSDCATGGTSGGGSASGGGVATPGGAINCPANGICATAAAGSCSAAPTSAQCGGGVTCTDSASGQVCKVNGCVSNGLNATPVPTPVPQCAPAVVPGVPPTLTAQTWTFDGNTWTQRGSAPFDGASLGTDTAHGQLVAVGNDILQPRMGAPTVCPAAGAVGSGSAGVASGSGSATVSGTAIAVPAQTPVHYTSIPLPTGPIPDYCTVRSLGSVTFVWRAGQWARLSSALTGGQLVWDVPAGQLLSVGLDVGTSNGICRRPLPAQPVPSGGTTGGTVVPATCQVQTTLTIQSWDGSGWKVAPSGLAGVKRLTGTGTLVAGPDGVVELTGGDIRYGSGHSQVGWAPMGGGHKTSPTLGGEAVAYDDANHEAVLFGGTVNCQGCWGGWFPDNTTWTWDGDHWTEYPAAGTTPTPAATPTPSIGPSGIACPLSGKTCPPLPTGVPPITPTPSPVPPSTATAEPTTAAPGGPVAP